MTVDNPVSVVTDGFVPVIDLASSLAGDERGRAEVAAAVGRACAQSGFFVIVGHGVPEPLVEKLESVSLDFFALPEATKESYAVPAGDPTIRGHYATSSYVAASDDVETAPDLCELYTVCRLGEPGEATVESLGTDYDVWSRPNPWPSEVPEFRSTWLDYYAELETVADHLMELFADALGLPTEFFADKIDNHITNLVVNFYPPVDDEPEPGQYRKGPHSDWGTLTVLYQDGTGGLEVLDRDNDEWVPVPIVPGSFVVNIGDLMEIWTNNRWRSTKHRVPVPPPEARSKARVSAPFFHQPNWDALVECLPSCLEEGEAPQHEPVRSGDYLLAKIRTAYE